MNNDIEEWKWDDYIMLQDWAESKFFCLSRKYDVYPRMPIGVEELYCYTPLFGMNRYITNIETFNDRDGNCKIWAIVCDNCPRLTSLPELPKTLRILKCYYSGLKSLPKLPESLEYLLCDDEQFETLTELPPNIKGIRIKKVESGEEVEVEIQKIESLKGNWIGST